MANVKLSAKTELTSVANGDFLPIIDVSDTTDGASGTSKKITKANLLGTLTLASITDVTASAAEVNIMDGVTSSTAELNILDGATLTVTELNYVDGVTSAIQTQLDAKAPSTSPTLVTPVLGAATATSINKVTITAPASSATLTLVTGSSLITSGANAITLTSTGTTNVTLPTTGTLATLAGTETFSNKRRTLRCPSITQAAEPAINTDVTDVAHITGLAQAITSMTTNLTGTPVEGDTLRIDITDNGTARAITWGNKFEASGNTALPTTTVLGVRLDVGFFWNTVTSKWRCVGVS